jgi:subtilisin family serine protease
MMGLTTVATAVALLGCHDLMAPLRSLLTPVTANKYLNPAGTVVVYPGNLHGWAFYDDQASVACTTVTVCAMVSGPASPPAGSGSAELATTTAGEGKALILADYKGVRFDAITALSYSTYRQSVDAGNNLAIALQFNVDYDLADAATGYQGRLVYEPYQGNSGTVTQNTWQNWDAKAGKWWGTRASVMRNGVATANPCVQATPCTGAALLNAFPNVGVHATYGAVVLKAGSGWASFRGNIDQFTIGVNGAVTTFDFEAVSPVPATAPLGTSQAVADSAHAVGNLLDNPSGIEGVVTRHTLFVRFHQTATQRQREDAIAIANADVVGGMHLGSDDVEGFYYVRLRNAIAVSPDSVTGPLLRARALLIALPFVRGVTYDRVDKVVDIMFRRPQDGPGFTTWRLNPDSAQNDNWHLDAIAAPFAWGCDIGGASATVAVVDRWFKHAPDLDANVSGVQEFSPTTLDTLKHEVPHGTWVAGLLAAKGDNRSAITGMAYAQKVALYNADLPDTSIKQSNLWPVANIQRAAKVNRIVNVSMGRQQNGTVTSTNTDAAADLGLQAEAALSLTSAFVAVAAGNDGVDASLAGYPRVLMDAEIAKRVLVVGGTQLGPGGVQVALNKLSGPPNHRSLIKTNTGPLVEIAAPGDVTTIGPEDSLTSATGTSMAAPLVSGAAALLLDFDPSLTASELKTLLIQGAVAGGRYIIDPANANHHIPILNAYESLKLAAKRIGAPLCGNRVWNDGRGGIWADRASGAEKLITRDSMDYAAFVNPFHGGHRLELGFSYQYQYFTDAPHWRQDTYMPAPDRDYGGAYLSYAYGSDHDNKLWTERLDTADGIGQQVRVRLLNAGVRTEVRNFGTQHIPGTQNPGSTCIMKFPIDANDVALPSVYYQDFYGFRCVGYAASGVWQSAPTSQGITPVPLVAVPSPQADFVYVPVSIRARVALYGDLIEICNRGDTAGYTPPRLTTDSLRRCRNPYALSDSAASAFVYRINVATGVWSKVKMNATGDTVRANREINSLSVSEDGKEMMLSLTRRASHGEFSFDSQWCHDETLEWVSLDQSPSATYTEGSVIKTVAVPQGASCGGWVEGGGTVSPNRTPQTPMLLASRAETTDPSTPRQDKRRQRRGSYAQTPVLKESRQQSTVRR